MTQEPGSWPDGAPSQSPPPGPRRQAQDDSVSPWSRGGQPPAVQPVHPVHPVQPVQPHGAAQWAGDGGPATNRWGDGSRVGGGWAGGAAPAVPPPPRQGSWKPARVEAVTGTQFGVVHLEIPPVTSGFAVGSLVAGIAAPLVGLLVLCFGVAGADGGWGAWVAGAFTLLGLVAGGGGVGLGLAALRQIRGSGRPGWVRFTGRGPAIGGAWCGGIGAGICLLSLTLVVVLQLL